MNKKYTDFITDTGLTFREKEFTISVSKEFVEVKNLEDNPNFITQHVLSNLYQHADVYFGKNNWYLTNYDFYTIEEDETTKKIFFYFVITCCGKVPEAWIDYKKNNSTDNAKS
ncbi:protein of unknown function [endosymbiont DhMRE of Dentiscutata heterogama]|uniref:hypothetical protein n=1 Tax=endosymbiont DhMRE of Dentiscutata heterogama TaxID=1609546 RepID=UPI000629DCF9|nr:hypothetical protein [endosymbiont DhMRE of Dentiscutata heterogama]CFW92982.1 protein of unknown function [endosymbiont DhMRE of Dentiscutata heterogama]